MTKINSLTFPCFYTEGGAISWRVVRGVGVTVDEAAIREYKNCNNGD